MQNEKMKGISLFSGIGGLDLALKEWVTTTAYCEIDSFCQAVLLSRMNTKDLDEGIIFDDVKRIDGTIIKGIDIIFGGFPCQDISIAGTGKGLDGERSSLFFEIVRLAKEIKPKFLFVENVPAITTRGGLQIVGEVAKMGYDCRWCVISAASVGACHKRERWFLLAYSNNNGSSTSKYRARFRECTISRKGSKEQKKSFWQAERTSCISRDVADSLRERLEGKNQSKQTQSDFARRDSIEKWSEIVSTMDKCSNGIQTRLDHIDVERCFILLYTYAETYNRIPKEILFVVWDCIKTITFQNRKTGTQANISKEDILHQFMQLFLQEFELNRNFKEFTSSKSVKTPKVFLRSVRNKHKTSLSSYRLRLEEQFSRKHSYSLQDLSLLLAQDIELDWHEKCKQDAKDYVASIKALGNAVVPCQAREAFRILSGLS